MDFGIFKESDQRQIFEQTALQKSVTITATQTKYDFTCGPIDLHVEFVSPLLMDDLDLLSRPVNYISYEAVSNDGQSHQVEVYVDATPEWAVNELNQEVQVTTGKIGDVDFAKAGTTEQPILKKKGDNVRIDWGYFYLAAQNLKKQHNHYWRLRWFQEIFPGEWKRPCGQYYRHGRHDQ